MSRKFLFNISNKLNKNIFNVFIAEILTFVILILFLYSSASSVEASKRNVQKISISTVAAKTNGKDIISPCENNASAAVKELEENKENSKELLHLFHQEILEMHLHRFALSLVFLKKMLQNGHI